MLPTNPFEKKMEETGEMDRKNSQVWPSSFVPELTIDAKFFRGIFIFFFFFFTFFISKWVTS